MRQETPYIYIVDDNTISLKILVKNISKSLDCKIRTFTTAEDCYRTVKNRLPDLILADYYLDSEYKNLMNGDDLLYKVKRNYPHLPVIMYSSTDSIKLVVKLIKEGAQDFIHRDENFIPTITKVTANEIEKKRTTKDYKGLLLKWTVLFTIILVGYFIVDYFKPEWLAHFFFISVFIMIGMTIRLKQKASTVYRV